MKKNNKMVFSIGKNERKKHFTWNLKKYICPRLNREREMRRKLKSKRYRKYCLHYINIIVEN